MDYTYRNFKPLGIGTFIYTEDYINRIGQALEWLTDNNIVVIGVGILYTGRTPYTANLSDQISIKFTSTEDLLAFTLLFRDVLE